MRYQYTAKDKFGKTIIDIMDSSSESAVAELLHKNSLVVVSIKPVKKKFIKARGRKIKPDDLVIFSRQLATLIDSGIPLVQSLGILIEQIENKNLKNVVTGVWQKIEEGTSFSDALAKYPGVFSELFINMSHAGEVSGTLDEVLERLATYLEKTLALTRKIRSSLVYPAVVVSMAIAITTFLLIKVVPTFKNIFNMLGGQLPLPTQILIGVSEFLRKDFLIIISLLVVLGFILNRYINTKKGRYNFDRCKLKMPVLGPLFCKIAVAKFSRTFSTLVRSGVTVLNALDIVAKTTGNKVMEEAVINSRTAVRDGEPIWQPLAKSGVFPAMVCRMISVGEQTGQLEKMLSKIAQFYEEQVDAAVQALTSVIEPIVIAFLGVVIGGIVIALFLPIFKITEIIGR